MALTQVDQGLLGTNAQYTGFKNRLINSAMVIDQRNAGASVSLTTPTTYVMDRWAFRSNTSITVQRSTTSTTGFINSAYVTVPTGAASSAGHFNVMQQTIEGFNISDLAWGTANASAVTLSFKVRSSQTGTFAGSIRNGAGDRSYVFTFSIVAANTWTSISVTVAGDTAGTWATDNTAGLIVTFDFGSGSTFATTANTWSTGNYVTTSGAVQLTTTSSATFYITGVQLEKGSTATSFDYRPYGTELALCQRYFCKTYQIETAVGTSTTVGCYGVIASGSTALIGGGNKWPVQMRATPTVTIYSQIGTSAKLSASGAIDTGSGVAIETPSQFGAVGIFASGGFTGATWYYGHFAATAEL